MPSNRANASGDDASRDGVRFVAGVPWHSCATNVVYRMSESSFEVRGSTADGGRSILVGDLQLEIDADGTVLYVWGYCPIESWTQRGLCVPRSARRRKLVVVRGASEMLGTSARLPEFESTPIYVSADRSWLCVGKAASTNREVLEICPGVLVALSRDGRLVTLWIRIAPAE